MIFLGDPQTFDQQTAPLSQPGLRQRPNDSPPNHGPLLERMEKVPMGFF